MTAEHMVNACAHKGERCWPCMTGSCYSEPTRHVWYDVDDQDFARQANIPLPSGLCGCAFCGWPALGLSTPTEGES